MNETLPLFDVSPPQGTSRGASPNAPQRAEGAARRLSPEDRHLRAAWRLSRGMWRYPEYSPEQIRAGRAICRHLRALLAESTGQVRETR